MTLLDLKNFSVAHGTTRTYYQVVVQGLLIDCLLMIGSLFGSLVINFEALIADLILAIIVLANQEVFLEHFLRNYC